MAIKAGVMHYSMYILNAPSCVLSAIFKDPVSFRCLDIGL